MSIGQSHSMVNNMDFSEMVRGIVNCQTWYAWLAILRPDLFLQACWHHMNDLITETSTMCPCSNSDSGKLMYHCDPPTELFTWEVFKNVKLETQQRSVRPWVELSKFQNFISQWWCQVTLLILKQIFPIQASPGSHLHHATIRASFPVLSSLPSPLSHEKCSSEIILKVWPLCHDDLILRKLPNMSLCLFFGMMSHILCFLCVASFLMSKTLHIPKLIKWLPTSSCPIRWAMQVQIQK